MQKRITDFITYVAGLRGQADEEEEQAEDDEQIVDRATEEQLLELREQTKEIFKNLFWTRVVAVHDYQAESQKSWPIAPDLSDEHDHMFTVAEDALPELEPYFDHAAFSKQNPQPQVAVWRLPEDRLMQLAGNVTGIRARIGGEVDRLREIWEQQKKRNQDQEDKSTIKLSSRSCNPEGLLEKEIKAREQSDQFPCFGYKKRKLYQLSSSEIDKIISTYLEDHLTQDETARKFRVSKHLVSKLVCMAQKEPEKLRERKQREKERQAKINVVKVAANQLLKKDGLISSSRLLQEKIADDFKVPVGSKFVRFVNMLINDSIFAMNEALTKLKSIKDTQAEMADEPTWNAQPSRTRQQREQAAHRAMCGAAS